MYNQGQTQSGEKLNETRNDRSDDNAGNNNDDNGDDDNGLLESRCTHFVCVTKRELKLFYARNPEIKESHGLTHVLAVYEHSVCAVKCVSPPLAPHTRMQIYIASLLHDVDDHKYFPNNNDGENSSRNAKDIMASVELPKLSQARIIQIISMVSCSVNGNSVHATVKDTGAYYLLIPRYSDRLEAVGARGVVRCYQYNAEHNRPMCSDISPRATSAEEVWVLACPERFVAYQVSGGKSTDMISHYYDKLFHIARPPSDIVRNVYLEKKGVIAAAEMVELCLRFGRTGKVDEEYIKHLEHNEE